MIRKTINRIKSSEFLVNITKLAGGTSIAQLIAIGTAPIVYRIYSKESYGYLAVYMAVASLLSVFSTLKLPQAILLENEDTNAGKAFWMNQYLNTLYCLVLLVFIISFRVFFIDFFGLTSVAVWVYLVPFSIYFGSLNEILAVWANRKKEYNMLTMNSILMALLVPLVTISLGLILKNETGLFVGLFAGQLIPAGILWFKLAKKYSLKKLKATWTESRMLLKKHREFPIYGVPSDFLRRFVNQMPVFMLNKFVGPGATGVYNLAVRMLDLPIQLVGAAISTVFQQRATEDYNSQGNCRDIFIKTFKTLSLISILPTLIILVFGPDLFDFFFGIKWREAGVFARALVLLFSVRLVISPLTYLYYIAQKQLEIFIIHIWIFISNAAILYFMLLFNFDLVNILLVYAINYSLAYVLFGFRSFAMSTDKSFVSTQSS